MDLQFFVDVFQMERHRVCGNAHGVRRGLVVMAFDHQLQQLGLLRRQMVGGTLGRTKLAEERNDAPRDVR